MILQIAWNISSSVWLGLVCKNLSSCYWSDGSATGDYFNFKGGESFFSKGRDTAGRTLKRGRLPIDGLSLLLSCIHSLGTADE